MPLFTHSMMKLMFSTMKFIDFLKRNIKSLILFPKYSFIKATFMEQQNYNFCNDNTEIDVFKNVNYYFFEKEM